MSNMRRLLKERGNRRRRRAQHWRQKDASSHQVVQMMATLNQHYQEVGGSRTGRELDINRCSGDGGENERHVGYLAEKSLYYSFRSPSPSSLASAFDSRRGLHRQAEQVPEEGQSPVERESPSCWCNHEEKAGGHGGAYEAEVAWQACSDSTETACFFFMATSTLSFFTRHLFRLSV